MLAGLNARGGGGEIMSLEQSACSRPEVHTFAWKMVRCIKYMGVNDMDDI